jgi:hypothetical protein
MKSQNTKKYLYIFAIIGLGLLAAPHNVSAYVPDIHVNVINSSTNAPVNGVWVKQDITTTAPKNPWASYFNFCNGAYSTQSMNGRYSQTVSGVAYFRNPEDINENTCNQSIDTNKDGTNDAISFPCTTGQQMDSNGNLIPGSSCLAYGDFSCQSNPMSFSVVKPVGDTGSYTTITGAIVPNSAASLEYTIYYTPAGSTPMPTPTPNPVTNASKKEIGTLTSIGSSFQPLTQVEEGKDYWVRIQVFKAASYSRVKLHEALNTEYFQLYQPYYSNANDASFFIESYKYSGYGAGMVNSTVAECPDPGMGVGLPACISGYTSGGGRVNVQSIDDNEALTAANPQKYFYFKVKAIKSSSGLPIKVDFDDTYPAHVGSYIDYIDLPDNQANEPGLDNVEVEVCPVGGCVTAATNGYFQVQKGDTYSNASGAESIKSLLPANTGFSPDNSSIILHSGSGANFGLGNSNPNNWHLKNYFVDNNLGYDKLYSDYSSKIVTKSINGINGFNSTGYYIDTSSQASSDHNYVLKGANWSTQLSGKQIVFFVPGDLYIESNTDVASTNGSSIIYVVKGNVGFDPSVTKFEGIIIADGSVDTACLTSTKFSGSTCSSGSASLANALTVEGMVYASGGFTLDRKAASGTSESFIGRPDFLLSTISTFGKNVYSWKEYAN